MANQNTGMKILRLLAQLVTVINGGNNQRATAAA
jgi:hypothetical protein